MNNLINGLEKLLHSGQDNALLRFGLGKAYVDAGDNAVAIEHLKKALELDPNYSAAWKYYAQALTKQQQLTAACEAYQQGIAVAEARADQQAVKEMRIFLQRLQKILEQ